MSCGLGDATAKAAQECSLVERQQIVAKPLRRVARQ